MKKLILLLLIQAITLNGQYHLANNSSFPEAVVNYHYLNYLSETKQQIISGQLLELNVNMENNYNTFISNVLNLTDKIPGIVQVTYDISSTSPNSNLREINKALIKHSKSGGLVSITYLPDNPWTAGDAFDRKQVGSLAEIIYEGTDANILWLKNLNKIAYGLKELNDSGISVLWNMLPEVNSTKYWWGVGLNGELNKSDFINLWKYTFNYLSQNFGLGNLIWTYSPTCINSETAQSGIKDELYYYPGNDVVDVVGVYYFGDTIKVDNYTLLEKLGKPLAISGFGPSFNSSKNYRSYNYTQLLNIIKNQKKHFCYWISACDSIDQNNRKYYYSLVSQANTKQLLNDSLVINQNDIINKYKIARTPKILFPLNNSLVKWDSIITVNWYSVLPDLNNYFVKIDLDSSFSNQILLNTTIKQKLNIYPIHGTTYYVQIKAVYLFDDNLNDSLIYESEITKFHIDTNDLILRAILVQPANGDTLLSPNVILQSFGGSDLCDFTISQNPLFYNSFTYSAYDILGNPIHIQLKPCKKYYWKSRCLNSHWFPRFYGSWSEIRTFYTLAGNEYVFIEQPATNGFYIGDSVQFSWTNFQSYPEQTSIEFANNFNFNNSFVDSSTDNNQYNYYNIPEDKRSLLGDTVYWRINLKLCGQWSLGSYRTLYFIPKEPSSVFDQRKVDFSLSPNPATDYIEISTPPLERGSGGVSIFDILGTEVLNNSQLSIFNSQLRIDVSHLAPGVYFVRVGDAVQKFVKF